MFSSHSIDSFLIASFPRLPTASHIHNGHQRDPLQGCTSRRVFFFLHLQVDPAHANAFPLQAASAIESFKIESPVKKLDFGANKENIVEDLKAKELVKKEDAKSAVDGKKAAAAAIKAAEADEPLLQENPQRFVLFPIKYHEVS